MFERDQKPEGPDPARLLDLRGLRCPLPALKTRRALLASSPGSRLVVLSDDPLAAIDIPDVARQAGADVLEGAREGIVERFVLRSGASRR